MGIGLIRLILIGLGLIGSKLGLGRSFKLVTIFHGSSRGCKGKPSKSVSLKVLQFHLIDEYKIVGELHNFLTHLLFKSIDLPTQCTH